MTLQLIDKQDTFEIVRDQIAAILATEIASQQALATAASKDPALWKLRIYTERANPWEQFLNNQADQSPLVNVYFDTSNFNASASNIVERQQVSATYNLDIIGYGQAADVPAGGHKPGDKEAAFAAQRAVRLVRNILMAGEYTYLDLRGTVWKRWVQSVTSFQLPLDANPAQRLHGARIAFVVDFNELSPQVQGDTLELISTTVTRADDGEILINADYDYT